MKKEIVLSPERQRQLIRVTKPYMLQMIKEMKDKEKEE